MKRVRKLVHTAALAGAAVLLISTGAARALPQGGWSISTAHIWRLTPDADYEFTRGSPAKIIEADRLVLNHQARYQVRNSLTDTFEFKVGCMFQSKTPAFELKTQPLDVRITDQFNGFAFARFMVDSGREVSLRGDFVPPARLIFAPLTKTQNDNLADLFLQMREGGELKIAVLQGARDQPRVFTVPLKGFIDFTDAVTQDCANLNARAGRWRGEVTLLPDYLTEEPKTYAPPKYSLKPQNEDGTTPAPAEDPAPKPEPAADKPPEVQFFTPGGGAASIGPDGKPITAAEPESSGDQALGQSTGPMQIGPDGKPVAAGQGNAGAQTAAPSQQ